MELLFPLVVESFGTVGAGVSSLLFEHEARRLKPKAAIIKVFFMRMNFANPLRHQHYLVSISWLI